MNMKVELEITVTYRTEVVVSGDFTGKDDPRIDEVSKEIADNMDHNSWDYKGSEFERLNVKPLPDDLSGNKLTLLQCGYPEEDVFKMTEEEAEGEVQEIPYSV